MSPITGPLVDKIGRKKAAILYCCLEILINLLEQYPFLSGLVASRMISGFTTNLLSSVFETWLDTEYRRRGFQKEKYEIIMRDSVIVSNLAAIFSGYLAHVLAARYGAIGPFEGAVTCTAAALVVVCFVWTENYGSSDDGCSKSMMGYFAEAVTAFREDRKMLIVGTLQGLTTGSIQIFVFLWAPTLRHFAQGAPSGAWGLDVDGEPAYGLIFGAFMGAGVLGGLAAPRIRQCVTAVLSPLVDDNSGFTTIEIDGEGTVPIRPMAVEFLASTCYFFSALLLFIPSICPDTGASSFSNSLLALLTYEFLIGIFMPCEGVIRSLYFPATARASIMALPRIIVNAAVAIGVVSTNFIRYVDRAVFGITPNRLKVLTLQRSFVYSLKTAFFAVGCLMAISSLLQISLISEREWSSLFSRFDRLHDIVAGRARSSFVSIKDLLKSKPPWPRDYCRRTSDSEWSDASDGEMSDSSSTLKIKGE
jgi:MFS transporter, MFS domain-containing protein family, molybdate-anion transporter